MKKTVLLLLLVGLTGAVGFHSGFAQSRGVSPSSAWQCPITHPIKGNFTPYSGERCIFHVPGGEFYNKTKAERCYATAEEAKADGCRASKR
jgi:hypothetical protein